MSFDSAKSSSREIGCLVYLGILAVLIVLWVLTQNVLFECIFTGLSIALFELFLACIVDEALYVFVLYRAK